MMQMIKDANDTKFTNVKNTKYIPLVIISDNTKLTLVSHKRPLLLSSQSIPISPTPSSPAQKEIDF